MAGLCCMAWAATESLSFTSMGPVLRCNRCACSRPGEIVRLPQRAANPDQGTVVYQPAECTCIATPSIPVEGRVTDQATGKPLAGLLVKGHMMATEKVFGGFEAAYVHTLTDADGRYRLEGLPLGENTFCVQPPPKSRYLASQITVTSATGSCRSVAT